MKRALFLGFAMLASAVVDCPAASAQSLYFNNVANTSCLSNTSCTFTFPTVTSTSSTAVLTVSKVSCRVISTSGVTYAALSKSANATKIEFLQHLEYTAGSNGSVVYIASVVDASTLFFVQAGTAPTIVINTGSPMIAPNSATDQPTCSVSGIIQ